ncbi:ATP-grasp domain-containing protein [Butyrivibrio sp. AE3004]|uniref:ATP-grasp domain-containing protein n=1 Tax=Butyrivibrio sp. AE3004 TaxID=1506994 RepID=UPI000494886D|nr:ATP-grasp domain-containing protein [Butyrivibrio sp. AE3004]
MQKKILIFPAGTEIAFEIQNSLKYSKFVKIYGGTSASDHSEFTYENLITGFPFVDDANFLDFLNNVIDENEIDCVYPAHDSSCLFCSEHADEIHAQVIITDKTTTGICRSKKKTYEFFQSEEFIPETYATPDEVINFPVFIKPITGQGSVGARKIISRSELDMNYNSDYVICEYLPGAEYTVDCFTDGNGELLFCRQRMRERIKTGISVRTRSMDTDDAVRNIANRLNGKLKFKGAWFFQVKKNLNGEYRLMEVSPRIPGTAGLYRNTGVNFPMLTLFVFWGYPVSIIENDYDIVLDRAFYSAFRIGIDYDYVYLDYDDILTLGDKVNADVMRFVYQARNKGKRIILLSKHSTDIHADLKKAGISEELFEDIQVLEKSEEKSDYIKETDAIFIDDSFAERKKVKEKCGIPVFDVDMIESLIDWKS